MVKVSPHRNILATNCVTCRIKVIFFAFSVRTAYPLMPKKHEKNNTCSAGYKSCQKFTTCFMFVRSVFAIYRCYIQFQLTLVTALYYFHEIIKMTPQVMLPNLKMTPQQNGRPWPWSRPPSRVINDQPIETFGKFAWFVKLIIFLEHQPIWSSFSVYTQQSMDSCNLSTRLTEPKS